MSKHCVSTLALDGLCVDVSLVEVAHGLIKANRQEMAVLKGKVPRDVEELLVLRVVHDVVRRQSCVGVSEGEGDGGGVRKNGLQVGKECGEVQGIAPLIKFRCTALE